MNTDGFDDDVISELQKLTVTPLEKRTYALTAQTISKKAKAQELVDVIYDHDSEEIRIEAMWVLQELDYSEKTTVYADIMNAEPNPNVKRWAEVLWRQQALRENLRTKPTP
jgi:hypothetical protein